MSQGQIEVDHGESDDPVDRAVRAGLAAGKQHARNKPVLPPEKQEELMRANFPRVPEGDDAGRLTGEEYAGLRASIQSAACERATRSIANLRDQLTEYHSMIDRLFSLTESYEALEREHRERGRLVEALEREVAELRGEAPGPPPRNTTGNVRRVSMGDPPAQKPFLQHTVAPKVPQFVQVEEETTNSASSSPKNSPGKRRQHPGTLSDTDGSLAKRPA